MNERIQELIKQATHVEEPDGLFPREVFDKEKFAELIVRECTNIILHYTDVDEGVAVARKHFGVE